MAVAISFAIVAIFAVRLRCFVETFVCLRDLRFSNKPPMPLRPNHENFEDPGRENTNQERRGGVDFRPRGGAGMTRRSHHIEIPAMRWNPTRSVAALRGGCQTLPYGFWLRPSPPSRRWTSLPPLIYGPQGGSTCMRVEVDTLRSGLQPKKGGSSPNGSWLGS